MIPFTVAVAMAAVLTLLVLPSGLLRESSPAESTLLRWFIAAKGASLLFGIFVASRTGVFFEGGSDALAYHSRGSRVRLDLIEYGQSASHREVPGTGAVDLATGYLYWLIGGPSMAASFAFAAALASIGTLLFWWAGRQLLGHYRIMFGGVVLFAPTVLYWTAGLSKDAIIYFGLGCLAAGISSVARQQRIGVRTFTYLVLGALTVGFIRPHVLLLLLVSVGVAAMWPSWSAAGRGARLPRLLLITIGAVGLSFALPQTSDLLRVEDGQSLVDRAYDVAETNSGGQGRSAYVREPTRSPLAVPGAVTTVLARPFLWEVRTPFQLLASVESVVVLGAVGYSALRYLKARADLFDPFVFRFAMVFVVGFCASIASYGNFGLIARQRAQVWPFLILAGFLMLESARTRRGIISAQRTRAEVGA